MEGKGEWRAQEGKGRGGGGHLTHFTLVTLAALHSLTLWLLTSELVN